MQPAARLWARAGGSRSGGLPRPSGTAPALREGPAGLSPAPLLLCHLPGGASPAAEAAPSPPRAAAGARSPRAGT